MAQCGPAPLPALRPRGLVSMSTPTADWPEILKAVALEVLGRPTERRRNEWRYGRHGSLAVHIGGQRAGSWRDFEAGRGGGVLDLLRHYEGLDKPEALEWLRARGLLQDSRPGAPGRPESRPTVIVCTRDRRGAKNVGNPSTAQQGQASGPDPDSLQRIGRARSWWEASQPIPTSPEHPARRWLANRRLWRPELPLPEAVRWAPATGQHTGAGAIVALAAQPVAWAAAWPKLPELTAVQLVHVDVQGQPALDRPAEAGGQSKRTMGMLQGAAVVLGNPLLPEALAPAHVAEGLADALGLASRVEGTSAAALGTSGMMAQDQLLAQWLAGAAQGVRIHNDADEAKDGRPPAGRRAAAVLMLAVNEAGGRALIVPPAPGCKDYADECAQGPDFGPLPEGWDHYATTLRETTNWPRWEIARVATTIMQEMSK